MEYKIKVKEGKNKLTVVAVDASGNTTSEEKEIETVTKPTIELKKSKGEIIIKVSDEKEIVVTTDSYYSRKQIEELLEFSLYLLILHEFFD